MFEIIPKGQEIPQSTYVASILSWLLFFTLSFPGIALSQSTDCTITVQEGEVIQNAIDEAASGDTICVEPGTFEEELSIRTSGISLVASDMDNKPQITAGNNGIMITGADSVSVQGFKIYGVSNYGINVENSNRVGILENIVTDVGDFAVRIRQSESVEVFGNELIDNYEGLYLISSDFTIVSENLISGTYNPARNRGHGIRSFSSNDLQILDNRITENNEYGIWDSSFDNGSPGALIQNNVITENGSAAIEWYSSDDAILTENTVTGNQGGIRSGVRSTIENNTIKNNEFIGIDVSHWSVVKNNEIDGASTGISVNSDGIVQNNEITNGNVGIRLSGFDDQQILNNSMSGNPVDILVSSAKRVAIEGNTLESGILIALGSYINSDEEANHHIANNTVQGRPLFFANGVDNPAIPSDAGQVIIVNSSNVVISGITMSNVVSGVQIVNSDGAVIENNDLTGTGDIDNNFAGMISVWQSDHTKIRNNQIYNSNKSILFHRGESVEMLDNTIHDNQTGDIRGFGGIIVRDAPNSFIENNTIDYHSVSGVGYSIRGCDGAEIRNNSVRNASGNGFSVQDCSEFIFEKNKSIENSGHGLEIRRLNDVLLSENVIQDNTISGIESDFGSDGSDRVTVIGNNLSGNGDYGALFYGGEDLVINDNIITENRIGLRAGVTTSITGNQILNHTETGIEIPNRAESIEINNNNISGNAEGISYSRSVIINAIENWWGDASGPSGGVEDPETGTVANGSGDSVSESIRFDPWRESGIELQQPYFDVRIESITSPVVETESLEVYATITNSGTEAGTQTIELRNFDQTVVDTLELFLEPSGEESIVLTWQTETGDAGSGNITMSSENEEVSESVTIQGEPVSSEITECVEIVSPGTYTLQYDLTSEESCIKITSSDVVLDGNGHIIARLEAGETALEGVGVDVQEGDQRLSNVTIKNVTLQNWADAVRFIGVHESEIIDINIFNSNRGIYLASAQGSTFNNIYANKIDRGISLTSLSDEISENNIFENIRIIGRGTGNAGLFPDSGIDVSNGSGNTFNNIILQENGIGLQVWGSAADNLFNQITIEESSAHGIELNSSNAGNRFDDITVDKSEQYGIYINQSDGNRFTNLTVTESGYSGIRLSGNFQSPINYVTDNQFENVVSISNQQNGISLSTANNNTFSTVTAENNGQTSVNFGSRSNHNQFSDLKLTGGKEDGISVNFDSKYNSFSGALISNHGTDTNDFGISIGGDSYQNQFTDIEILNGTNGFSIRTDSTTVDSVSISNTEGVGLELSNDASMNSLENIYLSGNATDFRTFDGATNNSINEMSIGESRLSLEATDVTISASPQPGSLPEDMAAAGFFVEIDSVTESAKIEFLRFHYNQVDIDQLIEEDLNVWRFDEQVWSPPENESYVSGVNIEEKYVFAENITEFSVFGVLSSSDSEPEEPQVVDAAASVVSATSPHISDGVDASMVHIELLEADGTPIDGVDAEEIDITLTGSALMGEITATDNPGFYSFSVTNTEAEATSISVMVRDVLLEDQPQIRFESAENLIPDPPGSLSIRKVEMGVELMWNEKPDQQITQYQIFRGPSISSLALYATIEAGEQIFIDQDLLQGSGFYAVQSINSHGMESGLSPVVSYLNNDIEATLNWELTSIPLGDASVETDMATLYSYDNKYSVTNRLESSKGYWIKTRSYETEAIQASGSGLDSTQIHLKKGWNLIGSLSDSVAVESISDPDQILTDASVFRFDEGNYEPVDWLLPYRGYWIFASDSGRIDMSIYHTAGEDDSAGELQKLTANNHDDDLPFIRFSNENNESEILLSDVRLDQRELQKYLLPPISPDPKLEVRTTSQNRIMNAEPTELTLQSSQYPVKMELMNSSNDSGYIYRLTVMNNDSRRTIDLMPGTPQVISEEYDSYQLSRVRSDEMITEHKLFPNYPNPFNPVTTIHYQVKEQSHIRVDVFDMIGRRIHTLIDGRQDSGVYDVKFDAGNLASGVYLIRFMVNDHMDIRKMTLIK